jgi:hypothetical protein
MAERLAYILKTRSISVILASLTLQLSGIVSNKSLAIGMAIIAGCVNWTAEYIKHKIGSKGVSIIIGVRRVRRVGLIPWLHAGTHK